MTRIVQTNNALFRAENSRRGFTIIEILVVLMVIGMLATLAIKNFDKILGVSSETIAKMYVTESIKTPLMSYRVQMGTYPSTQEGLQALISPPANRADRWRGPYIENGKLPVDPWGNPYQYRFPGTKNTSGYDVYSWGPDGKESDDDIGNW